jgi:hypothetical protein
MEGQEGGKAQGVAGKKMKKNINEVFSSWPT